MSRHRKPNHAEVRRATASKYVVLARALRPHIEPLLRAGYTWSEIGESIDRHMQAGSQGAGAPMSAKRPTDKPASGSDATRGSMFTPRARPYVWHSRDGAPIKTY